MSSASTKAVWFCLSVAVIVAANDSLSCLNRGRLFLFAVPPDRAPWDAEIDDAANMSQIWRAPALAFLAISSAAVCLRAPRGPMASARIVCRCVRTLAALHPRLIAGFVVACAADFVSTSLYCHRYGVIDEIHPGMRLVIYAYGLTTGVLLGKAIQALLLLVIAVILPRLTRPMLVMTIVGYALAAVWNVRHL